MDTQQHQLHWQSSNAALNVFSLEIMATRHRRRVLCLGVSYASIDGQLASFKKDLTDLDGTKAALPTLSSDDLSTTVSCVLENVLTQMDGRDLARVIETERVCKVDVYTVSQEKGAVYRSDRHYSGDFNHRRFTQALKESFPGVKFDEVVLDYFWIPTGWDRQHWSRSFFESTLASFATQELIGRDAKVYLPFCLHCLKQVLICQRSLLQHYNISFLRKERLNQVSLWKGTQSIDRQIMQGVLGKQLDQVRFDNAAALSIRNFLILIVLAYRLLCQEELYCTFGPRALAGDEADSCITKAEILNFCRQLDDFGSIRFIVLTALNKPTHMKTRKQQELSSQMGQIFGLGLPNSIRNGFDQVGSFSAARTVSRAKPPAAKHKRTVSKERRNVPAKRVSISPDNSPLIK